MMNKVIVYPGYDHVFQYLFNDLKAEKDVIVRNQMFQKKNIYRVYQWLSKHHLKNKYTHDIINQLLSGFIFDIHQVKKNDILVFSNISITFLSFSTLIKLKSKGIRLVLFFIDSLSNTNTIIALKIHQKIKFDLVYTFDCEDANKYGFIHYYTMYSNLFDEPTSSPIYDVIYNGSNKGRYEILKTFILSNPQLNIWSNMIGITTMEQKDAHISSSSSVDYKESIKQVLRSRCILDIIVDPKQTGLSLRVYEAVVYNKKLITNNPSIFNFPYYNPQYMKFTKDFKDIEDSFYNENISVDYRYNGDFSPVNFIRHIRRQLCLEHYGK